MRQARGYTFAGIILLLCLFLPGATRTQAQTLEEKAQICADCHGKAGTPQEKTTPIIWGQREGYLYLQLRDYKLGTRKNNQMSPIAEAMERDDMLALAAYFAAKPWPYASEPSAPPDVVKRALMASVSVGCTGCHLAQYQGYGSVPRIADQNRDYLANTIADFRSRERANNPGMSGLMLATSEADLAALVEYLAGR